MATRISHIPFFERLVIPDWMLLVAAVAYAAPAAALLTWKPLLGIVFLLAPIALLLASHGPAAVYVLIIATFLFMPLSRSLAILPADMVAGLLVAAYIIDLLCHGRSAGPNRLATPFIVYVVIILLSVAFAGFTGLSIKYFLRQVLLLGTFLAVAHFAGRLRLRSLFLLFVLAADANSIYSLLQFLTAGGAARTFGIAGRGFADHAMLAFLISVVYYLWSDDVRGRAFWGGSAALMVAAMAAAQTRASAITAAWGLVLLIVLALYHGKRLGLRRPQKNLAIAVVLGVFLVPLLILYTPIFEGIAGRFGRVGLSASGTILLRMTLWKAALNAFWANPIFGIGSGNFAQVYMWIPEVRFDPIFYLVSGMSTHAVMMSALAETGAAGFISLWCLFGKAIREAWRSVISFSSPADMPAAQCLLIGALVIAGSSFYAGSWFWGNNSYHMAVIFGLIASRLRPDDYIAGGRSV